MQKEILNLYFDVRFSIPITLVLEPSETIWERIHPIADGLIQSLPGRLSELYFLGNAKRYSVSVPKDFRDSSPGWFSENKTRVALINPVLENLEKKRFRGMVVVICSMPPVDVDDWLETEIIERTVFVRVGNESFVEDYNVIDAGLSINRIMEYLENPVCEVWIKGPDFVPLCFEVEPKVEVKVVYRDGRFSLQIPSPKEMLKLHLVALCNEEPPSLCIKRQKGSEEIINGKEEAPWFPEPSWKEIPKALRPVITKGIAKEDYECPQCGKLHPYNLFLCPEGDVVLKGVPLNTCILFTKENYFPLSEWYAYSLRNNQRIITKNSELYDYEENCWQFVKKIEPYEEVACGVWAIFHRI